ncbi:MAG TPA: PAS domain-containing sensor histidine kinase [Burkholderiaceae bacterium]|nr:PAS domain-containing sensor histidine kinase [Burkholderiaceae bacterium]
MPHDHSHPARPKTRGSPAAPLREPASPTLHELLHHGNGAAYRQLVDTIHDYAIFFLTPEGHIASWSPGAQRIKGYRAEEIIGEHFSIFYTPEALAQGWPAEELRRSAAEGRLEDEGWRLRKDGTRFWANVIITPLRGPSGQLLGYFKITRDLTEKREQEERLRESEQNLRLLVEGVQDHAMYLLDAGGHIRTWNSGAEKLLGYKAEQVVGAHVAVLYVQEEQDAGRPTAELSAVQASGFMRTEGWRQRADGSRFWADVAATHIQDAGGHSKGFVKLVRDLTERQRLEALETEGRQLSEFIAMLSHELRNPLAPIRNATALLRSFVDKPEAAGCLDVVDRQVAHLKRLVDDLLDVSRITKGKIRLEPAHLEFNTLVRMAVESCKETVKGHGHTMTMRLSNRQLPVTGDATRLTQLVVNLLNNAAKYTPRDGRIEVTVDQTNRFAILQVADNGIGMTQALLQRAFESKAPGRWTAPKAGSASASHSSRPSRSCMAARSRPPARAPAKAPSSPSRCRWQRTPCKPARLPPRRWSPAAAGCCWSMTTRTRPTPWRGCFN